MLLSINSSFVNVKLLILSIIYRSEIQMISLLAKVLKPFRYIVYKLHIISKVLPFES